MCHKIMLNIKTYENWKMLENYESRNCTALITSNHASHNNILRNKEDLQALM